MKPHTSEFKNIIKSFGRELDSKITYTLNGETTELGSAQLNSVTPHYEATILKSVMKQLDIDSNVEIPLETELNYQFGVKIGNSYEYLDFGNYIVYSSEKQEDTNSYKIICYDKMLYAMKPYESLNIAYPITIKDYLIAISNKLGLEFANDEFVNYDKQIPNELYLDAEGNSLDYTFRDVLDELSQVTASVICINGNDELEVRYIRPAGQEKTVEGTSLYIDDALQDDILFNGVNNITQTNNDLPFTISLSYTDNSEGINEEYLKDINVNFGEKYGPVNSVVLSRSAESDNIYQNDQQSIEENGLCEIKIVENQILNSNDRDIYLQDIFKQLNGLEYYINDFSSTGVAYYDLMDRYNVSVGENNYSCVMFNDEINITQGLEENIYSERIENSETDYTKSDKTDRRINQAISMVDKQNLLITNLVSQTTQTQQLTEERLLQLTEVTNSVQNTLSSTAQTIEVMQREIVSGKETLQNSLVTIDINGISVSTSSSAISTLMTNDTFVIKSGDTYLAYFGYDETINSTKAEMDNLTVTNYLVTGYHRIQTWETPDTSENRTGFFWIGG